MNWLIHYSNLQYNSEFKSKPKHFLVMTKPLKVAADSWNALRREVNKRGKKVFTNANFFLTFVFFSGTSTLGVWGKNMIPTTVDEISRDAIIYGIAVTCMILTNTVLDEEPNLKSFAVFLLLLGSVALLLLFKGHPVMGIGVILALWALCEVHSSKYKSGPSKPIDTIGGVAESTSNLQGKGLE